MNNPNLRAVLTGTGAYLPAKRLTNDDLSRMVDTSDEWIYPRTGIRSRRIAAEGENVSDMAAAAGRQAIANAGAVLGRENPRVGLLSIGTEPEKGNAATKETHELLAKNPLVNFMGNVEGHDLFKGEMDVCVADGFVGNVVLKTIESEARAIKLFLKREFLRKTIRKIGALLL